MFTFDYIREQLTSVRELGYTFMGIHDYVIARMNNTLPEKFAVLRVDVDRFMAKTDFLLDAFAGAGVHGSFYFRMHAPDYNLMSFENYRILKRCRDMGNEIGLHTELMDQSAIWNEDPSAILRKDLAILSALIERPIYGTAAHRDITGRNNLDFWKDKSPEDFSLLYEAYDKGPNFGFFDRSRYVSDSEWYQWKSYDNGILRENDRRSPAEHATDGVAGLYLLIHADTYYRNHIYE